MPILTIYHKGFVVDENTLQTSNPDIFAIGDCIAIGGQACRFVAPLREQGNAIAHQILNLEHDGYQHKAPHCPPKNQIYFGNDNRQCG